MAFTQCPECKTVTSYNECGIGKQVVICVNKHPFYGDVNRLADRFAPHGKKITCEGCWYFENCHTRLTRVTPPDYTCYTPAEFCK